MSSARTGIACAVVVWLAALPAVAQPSGVDIQKAKEHYGKAEAAMDKGDYAFAAEQYGIAYDYTKDAVLFFKIGTANDKAGNCEAALVYYNRYLREANPDEKFAALTLERVAVCQEALASKDPAEKGGANTGESAAGAGEERPAQAGEEAGEQAHGAAAGEPPRGSGSGVPSVLSAPAPDPDARPSGPGESGSSWRRNAAWISVGVAVALTTTGTVLGLSATSREEDLQALIDFRDPTGRPLEFSGTTEARYEELVAEGERFAGYSKLALAGAGAAAAAAAVFFILDARSPASPGAAASSKRAHLLPVATPGGIGVAAGWDF